MEVKIWNVEILELLVSNLTILILNLWTNEFQYDRWNQNIIVLHTRMIRFFSIFWIITVLQISFNTKSNDVLSHYSMHKYSVVYFSLRLLVVLIPNMASLKRYLFKIIMLTTSSWIRLLLLVLGFLCIVTLLCYCILFNFSQSPTVSDDVPWFHLLYWNSFVHKISVVYILVYTYLLFWLMNQCLLGSHITQCKL